ncbi:MAG: hypothetical protein QOG53_1826 [Frankiales bacterium]|jgi:hypothetical protein|nr:hypothetical protein [Frankiales bacterium]
MAATTPLRATLQSILDEADAPESAAARICMSCADLLPVTGAAIAIAADPGVRGTVCVSDAVMQRVEDLQFTSGVGPCVEAIATGKPVLVPMLDDAAESRWPGFSAEAHSAGVAAIFALPLRIGAIRLGVIDLYRDTPGRLSTEQLADASLVADAATLALIKMHDRTPAGDFDEDWWDLGSFYRAEIHQATGMVMGQLDVTATEALVRLRAHAYAMGVSTSALSRRVVAGLVDLSQHGFGVDA